MDALKNNKVLAFLILGLALVAALVLFSMFNQLGQEEEEEVIEPEVAPAPAPQPTPAPEAAPLDNPLKVQHNWNSPVVLLNQEQSENFLAGLKPAQNGHPAGSDGTPYREATLEDAINTPLVPESLE